MGCCSSKQIDTTGDGGPTDPKPATNATSPETKISTARQASLPTGTDMAQFGSSGRAAGRGETMSPPAGQDSTHTGGEEGGLGQRAGPRNTDRSGTAAGRPKPSHRSIPRAKSHTYVGGFNPPETPGRTPSPPPLSAQHRRRSVSAPSDEALESKRHSWVNQSAPGGSLPATTDPDIKKLWDGLSSPSGKPSETLGALDLTGRLEGRTKPKFIGSLSDVSQAKFGDSVVAVKALRVGKVEDSKSRILKQFARVLHIWAALDHPNVLGLLGFAFEDDMPCLISPWCDNGTLQAYLLKFPDANRRRLVREIADGLRYLHLQTPPIIHGDLKTTNVYVTGDYVAKISDFGTSRRVEELKTGFTTAGLALIIIRYNAPEILLDGQHPTLSSDVFSFGCVALETMTDKYPFWKIENNVDIIKEVAFQKQTPSPEDHPGMEETLWELLRRCWNYEPSDRPEMTDVCKTLAAAGYGPTTSDHT